MTPLTPPSNGDVDVWAYLANATLKAVIALVKWLEFNIPIMLPAVTAAYFMGKHWGYKGAALKLFMGFGVFCSVVGTPAALQYFGLIPEVWTGVIACTLSVFCYRLFVWAERVIARKIGYTSEPRSKGGDCDV